MHLFFQILDPLLLKFCMDDLEYMSLSIMWTQFLHCFERNFIVFICIIIKLIIHILLSISLSHTLNAFVPYRNVVILSNVCNMLSSLLLSAIIKQGICIVFKLKLSFYYTLFCSFSFFMFTIIIRFCSKSNKFFHNPSS